MKMKKVASVFLALSLTLGVCACGSESDGSKASAPEESSAEVSKSSEQSSEEKPSESEGETGADSQVKLRIAIGKHSADVSDNNDFPSPNAFICIISSVL